ncbi:MAG: DUF2273 domain-containing protein [Aerococcus sp.]|nr:DUF2273 domain-containing protein [Aerococcus sp.]
MNQWLRYWYTYRGRIIATFAFFLLGILLVTVGLGRTLVILLFAAVGYLIGEYVDGGSTLLRWLRSLRR